MLELVVLFGFGWVFIVGLVLLFVFSLLVFRWLFIVFALCVWWLLAILLIVVYVFMVEYSCAIWDRLSLFGLVMLVMVYFVYAIDCLVLLLG